ncbi:DUF1648 domain-containing protein [Bacteroides sedimenti]
MLRIFPPFYKNQQDIRLPRTKVDKIMEAIALLLLIATWLLAIIFYPKLPDVIPVHFNFAGEADGWGSKSHLFILAAVATLVMALTGFSAYYPMRMTNLRIKFTEETKATQLFLASRLLRTVNILIGVLFILVEFSMASSLFTVKPRLFSLLTGVIVILLLLSILVYFALARKYRK